MRIAGLILGAAACLCLVAGEAEAKKSGKRSSRSHSVKTHVHVHVRTPTRAPARAPTTARTTSEPVRYAPVSAGPAVAGQPGPAAAGALPSRGLQPPPGLAFPSGALAMCNDGQFAMAAGAGGVCSGASGGVKYWPRR